MDYTNMTFGDLLVADVGDLPKHTCINEDIYDLLTLPYTSLRGARTQLSSSRLPRTDEGFQYHLTTTITKDNVEATLKTKFTVRGRDAAISEYSGRVKTKYGHIDLSFSDNENFQEYLGDVTSALLWMDGIENNPELHVVVNSAKDVTPECVGMLYHTLQNMEHERLPEDPDMRRLMSRETVFVTLDGEGDYHTVSVLRPDARVDDARFQERYTVTYKPAFNYVEMIRERRPNDEKTLRRLVTNGEPLVKSISQSMHLENVNGLTHLTAVRELMNRIDNPQRATDPQYLLDDLAQDEHTL